MPRMPHLSDPNAFATPTSRATASAMPHGGTGPLRTLTQAALMVVALAGLMLWGAQPALAHTALVEASPAEGSEVEAPTELTLTFSGAVLGMGDQIAVVDAEGTMTTLTPTYPEEGVVSAQLPALAPGLAAVTWYVVSGDGHPVEGVLTFTVIAPEGSAPEVTEASPQPSSSPEDTQVMVTQDASPTPSTTPAAPGTIQAPGSVVWAWVLVGVVVLAGVAALLVLRRAHADAAGVTGEAAAGEAEAAQDDPAQDDAP